MMEIADFGSSEMADFTLTAIYWVLFHLLGNGRNFDENPPNPRYRGPRKPINVGSSVSFAATSHHHANPRSRQPPGKQYRTPESNKNLRALRALRV